jgi:hypothetical protein
MDPTFKNIMFILISVFITWEYYSRGKEVEELKETIFVQHQAIDSQNLLINFYKNKFHEESYNPPFYESQQKINKYESK